MTSNLKIIITPNQALKLEKLKHQPFLNARLYVRKSHKPGEGGYEMVCQISNPLYENPDLEGGGKIGKKLMKTVAKASRLGGVVAPMIAASYPQMAVGLTAASIIGNQIGSGGKIAKKNKYTLSTAAKKKPLNT